MKAVAIVAFALVAGCGGDGGAVDSVGGAVVPDSGSILGSAAAAGPAAQVTKTDFGSVRKAGEFQLTDDNFGRFLAASDSLVALKARDPQARAYLETDIDGAGSTDADAGLKYLQARPEIVAAIESTGISVTDYFIAAIAVASGQRHMHDAAGAPPTPATRGNAEFLKKREADLAKLTESRRGLPPVVIRG